MHIAKTALAFLFLSLVPALAHHGWSWTADGFFELRGKIVSIDLGNPHAMMDVDVEGAIWRVELAPPAQTSRSGFSAESASAGDEITAIGNRSQDAAELRMKAVRITVRGKTFDVYPNRVPASN